MKIILFSVILFLPLVGIAQASSEAVLITHSPTMERAIFDGKWTNYVEWKNTSWNEMRFEGEIIQLRSAHFENFIYVFIDAVSDNSIDMGKDKATICFDTRNNKAENFDDDDYCFSVSLGENEGTTLQGDFEAKNEDNLQKIDNPDGLIAISTISDENDPYSNIPHTGYEFKIPTDLVGRSNSYGFYVHVFDYSTNRTFTWPTSLDNENNSLHPPSEWGELISPDNSLPEFELPLAIILPAIIAIVFISRLRKNLFN